MPTTFRWTPFDGLTTRELHDALQLRADVFVVEQDCVYADVDGADPDAFHLLAHDGERLVAYLRVFAPGVRREEVVVGRVVTGPRGRGLGTAIMREALQRIEQAWPGSSVWLSAQAHLAEWYGRLGFAVCGPGYDEDGIPHVPMARP